MLTSRQFNLKTLFLLIRILFYYCLINNFVFADIKYFLQIHVLLDYIYMYAYIYFFPLLIYLIKTKLGFKESVNE